MTQEKYPSLIFANLYKKSNYSTVYSTLPPLKANIIYHVYCECVNSVISIRVGYMQSTVLKQNMQFKKIDF